MPKRIKLVAVGKPHQVSKAWLAQYEKRTGCEVIEVKESTPEKEGADILKGIKSSEYVILFDIKGQQFTSEEFAKTINDQSMTNNITVVIGGHKGVAEIVRQRANLRISIGKLTLAHQVARLVIMEQLYRAQAINKGLPYHK